ncbi:hypothetical protein DFQ27_003223 [Actinomortierella ambigua]|uniref:Small ribosomal subunit protein mS38 n=1 Tax=Actinomortierella ambigua TaxID=1343610 RepID=A0A9P6Q8R6_9FUNG|nr:hypothetical protein DFQ27_003223 [Actinomortierella ambigua]
MQAFTALRCQASRSAAKLAHHAHPKRTALRALGSTRSFQSSSSSSRNNDNNNTNNNSDNALSPIDLSLNSDLPLMHSTLELHRVDLAHGNFFALHRPLLGITNGPMFAQQSMASEEDFEDPVEDLTNYFATLRPFSPPESTSTTPVATATAAAWASMPQTIPDADQAVQDFLSQAEWYQLKSIDGAQNSVSESIASILDPQLDEDNTMQMTSVMRKRRIKMKKHKYKKLRKRTRALRKKLGK